MSTGVQRHKDVTEGMAAIERVRSTKGDGLFLFFGTEDPASGESWCSDCRIFCPLARAACFKLRPDVPLQEVPVGLRSEWASGASKKSPVNSDPELRITNIPTLVRFKAGRVFGRLVEGQLSDNGALSELLAK